MASVPLPARMNGWLAASACQTWRIRSSDEPKDSIRRGDVWDGGGLATAARTAGESSTGPGIMRRESGFGTAPIVSQLQGGGWQVLQGVRPISFASLSVRRIAFPFT